MIIMQLTGGTANQMFQYALGRRLSYKQGVPLKLDTESGFVTALGDTPRIYTLNHFHIAAEVATQAEIDALKSRKPTFIEKLLGKKFYIKESARFQPEILKAGPDAYLQGFWQSEEYFSDIADVIRQDFQVVDAVSAHDRALLDEIDSTNSVSLHVRRGDYVANPSANSFHGVCSVDYYKACIKLIKEKVVDPHFFIFSDDPDWAKANIPTDAPTQVSYNSVDLPYDDIRLMSHCKHNIIANSSFSWWGAWLNPNPQKIVCAPKRWFTADIDTEHLVPQSWVRID